MSRLVAVKIPLYNSEDTIIDTINSLLKQTFFDFNLYIYDNCSNDNSKNLVETFKDERIKYVKHSKNFGWNYNFDYCLKNTDEDYTLIAHADDIYHPNFIEYNLLFIKKSKSKIFFTQGISFRSKKPKMISFDFGKASVRSFNHNELFESVCLNGNFLYCPTLFANTKILIEGIGGFNGTEFGGSADLDAWLRLSKTYNINLILTPGLFYHRVSKNQLSSLERNISESFFVKCLNFYLDKKHESYETLKDYILWHKYFHELIYKLKSKINFNLKLMISKIFSLKVRKNKKIKLISLAYLIYGMSFMPKNVYLLIFKFINKTIR